MRGASKKLDLRDACRTVWYGKASGGSLLECDSKGWKFQQSFPQVKGPYRSLPVVNYFTWKWKTRQWQNRSILGREAHNLSFKSIKPSPMGQLIQVCIVGPIPSCTLSKPEVFIKEKHVSNCLNQLIGNSSGVEQITDKLVIVICNMLSLNFEFFDG